MSGVVCHMLHTQELPSEKIVDEFRVSLLSKTLEVCNRWRLVTVN